MGPTQRSRVSYHKGKPSKASIIGMTTFTRRLIAGHITQVYFSLSAKQDWHRKDGLFDYSVFFWTIYDLFEDTEWAADVMLCGTGWFLGPRNLVCPLSDARWPQPSRTTQGAAHGKVRAGAEASNSALFPCWCQCPRPI
ncbi:hypothetical protein K438DRAFT_1884297, partial [Mycena galopus ATCC 62051]